MIKVLPLVLIPSFFLLVFLNVKNLTSQNDVYVEENSNTSEINEDEIHKQAGINNEKLQEIKNVRENLKTKHNSDNKLDKKIFDPKQKNKKIGNESVSSSQEVSKNLKSTTKKTELEVSDKKKELSNKDEVNSERKIKIQFGAFSKINNAEKHKRFVIKEIMAKYPDFENNVEISSENNLFKVLYYSVNMKTATSMCKFSKSIKINCLILK